MPKQKPVSFLIWLTEGTRCKSVQSELDVLFNGKLIIVKVMETRCGKKSIIACKANQEIYEEVFKTKLTRKSTTKKNALGSRTFYVWDEDKSAQIPETLKDLVESITLQQTFIC